MAEHVNSEQIEVIVKQAGFMAGGGEMGERMRAFDWAKTSIGAVDTWPQSLRTTLSIILNSKFPMFLWWGEDLIQFYNDAYRPSLGTNGKHPAALGQRAEDCWPEIWHIIKPLIDQVRLEGEATWNEDQLVPLYRNGQMEDTYWIFSYSPVYDESGNVGGVLVVCNETTEKVINVKKLEESKEYLQNAVDIAELGTFKVDVAANTGSYSENVRGWFELDSLKESMQVIFGRIHEEDRRMVLQSITESLESEAQSRHDISYRVITSDGSIHHLRSMGKSFFSDGVPHSIIGIIQDITPQIAAHKKLEESESRFRHMVEQAPVAIGLTRGQDHFIESMNAPMLRIIIGKENGEEAVGKILTDIISENKDHPILDIYSNVLETGEAYSGNEVPTTYKLREKLEQHYFNVSCTPLIEEGKITGIIHVAVDVTEQVEARKKIEESEKALNHLANAMPQVVWIAEANGEVSFYNHRISALEGAQKLPDGTWSWKGVLVPEDEYPTVEAWSKAVAEGTVYEKEHRLKMKDGSFRWHLSRAYPQRDEKGNIVKWYGTATDVHAQKETEEAFRKSEEQLRIALEGAELGTFRFCTQSGKVNWSAKTKELYGLHPEAEVTTDIILNAMHPEDRARSYAVIQEAMRPENGGIYENEYRVIGVRDGKLRWLRSKGKVSFDNMGVPLNFTGVTQDITQRRQAEEAMKESNAELIRINNDLDNFIYTASHDLKAPISNIEGLLHALLRTLPPESLASERNQRITALMLESVERFKKTIASLTEVVKLQKENSQEAVMVDLEEVIKEVCLDLEQAIQSSGTQIELELADCHTIRFSEKNLRSVIYNLLSNSIKFSSPERAPRVQLRCQSTADHLVLLVKDNGLGMDPRRTSQLFTMFKRFHSHIEGTGIGLYMVKKMVDNAGGHIEVDSQPGVGTTFRVYFRR